MPSETETLAMHLVRALYDSPDTSSKAQPNPLMVR
jgi:hypothetical protein